MTLLNKIDARREKIDKLLSKEFTETEKERIWKQINLLIEDEIEIEEVCGQ